MIEDARGFIDDIEEAGDLLINHVLGEFRQHKIKADKVDLTREFNTLIEKSVKIYSLLPDQLLFK